MLQKFIDAKRVSETKQKEHGIVEYTIDGIEVEFFPTDNDSMWIPAKDESYDQYIFQLRNSTGKTFTSAFINTIKRIRNAPKDQLDLQYLNQ